MIVVVVGCLTVTGCSRQPEPVAQAEVIAPAVDWLTIEAIDMTATQRTQQELAVAATNALMSELLGELEAALASGGGPAGIQTCREKAPEIAAHVSQQFGLKIGRTSHRLRSPNNTPPAWAQLQVANQVTEPTYLAGSGGQFAALLPIRLKAECQMCHGPAEAIDEDIQRAIATFYPNDQAVGFTEGDLRGWIWVEVPPGEPESVL